MLNIGDAAPDFSGNLENGEEISLKEFRGKKLVLYFYPKDLTPGCALQAHNLSAHMKDLNEKGYEVLGVSADTEKRHCKFIDKIGIKFHLLSDPELKTIKSYEAWGIKKFMGRTYEGTFRITYIIDEEGKIARIIRKVKTNAHYEQIVSED
jgi:thioredoxin-dependent peroxiredoxin